MRNGIKDYITYNSETGEYFETKKESIITISRYNTIN